ncbi:MAG: DUF4139 domain-containing protein [Pseudorhodobacter sp.]|nr:DUF4139 domain-containing protein [Pseudorhodobacter sp.]
MTPRLLCRTFALASLLALPLNAETSVAASHIARVTLYPWGASVVREVAVDLPAGRHELIIPDLPLDTDGATLHLDAPASLTIGAVNLQQGRLPPQGAVASPAVQAAEAAVKRATAALRAADDAIAAIELKAQAAQEQLGFLRGLSQTDAVTGTVEDLRALSRMVAEEALAALQVAQQAGVEAATARPGREDLASALEDAEAALAALTTGETGHAALTLALDSSGEPVVIAITTFTAAASWQPVYDLRLTTLDPALLALDRAVLISQDTGEDWMGAALTLSTARPIDQSSPGTLWPELRRIAPKVDLLARAAGDAGIMAEPMASMAAPMVESRMSLEMMGATVTYSYPTPVDIRDGVESLRLTLDTLTLTPKVVAAAVPRADATAFLVAELVNTSPEPLLPGPALLYLDGALVGQANLDLLAAGAQTEIGFGPIDGLRLTRTVPERSQGDSGLISVSTEISEVAVIGVENLTTRAWPVRLVDQVPYSEQDDLEISYRAIPPATDHDMKGQRGLLQWDLALKPGENTEIRLESRLRWPEGQALQ